MRIGSSVLLVEPVRRGVEFCAAGSLAVSAFAPREPLLEGVFSERAGVCLVDLGLDLTNLQLLGRNTVGLSGAR